jgi:hypothetical protein
MTLKCPTCEQALGAARHVFALQAQHVQYTLRGKTPDEQAVLSPLGLTTLARYCTKACCKKQLPERLEQLGLPAGLQYQRVAGGPIAPCGHCGKPVNMTKAHIAVIRGDVTLEAHDEESHPDVQTIHTVLCKACLGTQAQELMTLVRDHQKKARAAQRKARRAGIRRQVESSPY